MKHTHNALTSSMIVLATCSALASGCVEDVGGDLDDDLDDGGEVVAETESALTSPQLLGEFTYSYAGWPTGISYDILQGRPCSHPERERAFFTVSRTSGSGHCEAVGWATSNINDCTVRVHVGANWNEAGVCTTRIHEFPANVVIFEHAWWEGASKRFDPGNYGPSALGIGDNKLSSLRVPKDWTAHLFDNPDFTGDSIIVTADTPYVGNAFNDRTSSMIVTKAPGAPN